MVKVKVKEPWLLGGIGTQTCDNWEAYKDDKKKTKKKEKKKIRWMDGWMDRLEED